MQTNPLKTPSLNLNLIRKIFTTASIRRWNDQAVPLDLVELDKQAHKIVIAYFLAHLERQNGAEIDFSKIILEFCFEFFERMILTDIKPPVFYELKRRKARELADFVCAQLENDLSGFCFFSQLKSFLISPEPSLESRILHAAHDFASKFEFDIIYDFAPNLYDVKRIKAALESDFEQYLDLHCVKEMILRQNLREILLMFGQLRFQKRWSQTPRVPQTSVLGHTLIVALCGYLLGYDLGFCPKMQENNFFCGLFHDLPEILTRDIISPIKHNVKGLDLLVKQIEKEAVNEKIISKLPKEIGAQIAYFTEDEFSNRVLERESLLDNSSFKVHKCEMKNEEFLARFNQNEKSPIFGRFLKYCDHLSAFLEAKISISHGISSDDLERGSKELAQKYSNFSFNGLDLGVFFRQENWQRQ